MSLFYYYYMVTEYFGVHKLNLAQIGLMNGHRQFCGLAPLRGVPGVLDVVPFPHTAECGSLVLLLIDETTGS